MEHRMSRRLTPSSISVKHLLRILWKVKVKLKVKSEVNVSVNRMSSRSTPASSSILCCIVLTSLQNLNFFGKYLKASSRAIGIFKRGWDTGEILLMARNIKSEYFWKYLKACTLIEIQERVRQWREILLEARNIQRTLKCSPIPLFIVTPYSESWYQVS